jgi:hypothetical protein
VADQISVHDRVQALDRLSQIAAELNQLAAWLTDCGAVTEGDKCEHAAEQVCTAAWLLERPIRPGRVAAAWQGWWPSPGGYVVRPADGG